jgi:hypothetical protein
MGWFIQLLVAIGLQILGYMLAPKPPGQKPPSLADIRKPTAEAGRPIPVLFGTRTIEGPNNIWSGDVEIRERDL